MIEKEYYRLGELEGKFGFTAYDFRYFCENHAVPLTIFVHSQFFLIAQRILSPTKRLARGVVCYQGLVELPPSARSCILENDSVQLKFGYLKSNDGIKMLESVSQELLQTRLQGDFDIECVSNIYSIEIERSDALFLRDEDRELTYDKSVPVYEGLEVKFADLVVQKDSIDWCLRELGLNNEVSDSKVHPMKVQIKKLMNLYPRLKAAQLYSLILANFRQGIDDTDPDCLLIDVSPKEIIWAVENGPERTMSKKRFQNIFSELKKEN